MTPPKPEPVDTAETAAKARECWCRTYPNAEKRRAKEEKLGDVSWFFSAEQMEEAYTAGYLAAAESESRDAALVADAEARGARRVLEEIADRADDIHTGSLAGDYWLAFREIVCKYKYTKGGADEQGE